MPLLTLIYLCSSLDKSNLGNAKSLGMMKDLGKDPNGDTYALLNSLYYVSYAPLSQYLSDRRKSDQTNTSQWCLLLSWANEHAWSQSSLSVRSFGVLPQRALLVYKTTRALLCVDSSSVLEVCLFALSK